MAEAYLRHARPVVEAMVREPAESDAGNWTRIYGPNTLVFDEVARRVWGNGD